MDKIDFTDIIGKKFVDGGRGPDVFDCWGLAKFVFNRYGITIPDYFVSCANASLVHNKMQEEKNKWEMCVPNAVIPSLVVFKDRGLCRHVGVYIGGGRFIHAYDRTQVAIVPTDHMFWKSRIFGYYAWRG